MCRLPSGRSRSYEEAEKLRGGEKGKESRVRGKQKLWKEREEKGAGSEGSREAVEETELLPQVLSYSHEAPSSSEFYPVSLQSILLDLSKYLFLPVKKSSTYKRAFSDCQGL